MRTGRRFLSFTGTTSFFSSSTDRDPGLRDSFSLPRCRAISRRPRTGTSRSSAAPGSLNPFLIQDSYTSHIKVRSKKPYRPIVSGNEVSSSTEGNEYVVETEEKKQVRRPSIVCGNYQGAVTDENGLRVGVWSFAEKAPGLDQLNKFARQLVDTYSKAFVPYPLRISTWSRLSAGVRALPRRHDLCQPGCLCQPAELHEQKVLASMLDNAGIGYFEDSILSTRGSTRFLRTKYHTSGGVRSSRFRSRRDRWLTEAFGRVFGLSRRQKNRRSYRQEDFQGLDRPEQALRGKKPPLHGGLRERQGLVEDSSGAPLPAAAP